MLSLSIKRLSDFCIALLAFLLLSPLILLVMSGVRLKLGSPVFFTQWRIGLGGREFKIYKLRTMTGEKDNNGNLLPDEKRLTKFGDFLRKSSLDELPELINVLQGNMSLVGPRPLPVKYRPRFTSIQWKRHEVKPGITGLAQINGRNALTWDEKFKLDVWYVDNWSLLLDLKVLIGTVLHLVQRKGISHEGHATMPEFFPDNDKIDEH